MKENTKEIKLDDLKHSINRFIRYCLRKWWVFVIAGILGGVSGIAYAWLKKPRYTANILFALEDNGGGLSGALSLAAEFGLNLGGANDVFAGDNILVILTSREMVEKVLMQNDTLNGKVMTMAQRYAEIYKLQKAFDDNKRLKGVKFPPGQLRSSFTYQQDSALSIISGNIRKTQLIAVRPDRKLNVYSLSMTSMDERFSKVFAEKLLIEANKAYTEIRSSKARETLQILEDRVTSIKGGMSSAIDSRAAVQDANLNPAFASAQAPLQRKQFEITSYGQAYAELFKNLELARFQYLKSIPLLQVIEPARYPLKFEKPGRLKTGITFGVIFLGAAFIFLLFVSYNHLLESESNGEKS